MMSCVPLYNSDHLENCSQILLVDLHHKNLLAVLLSLVHYSSQLKRVSTVFP